MERFGERMRKRRVIPAGCLQKWRALKSARTQRNPRKRAVVGEKKPTKRSWFFNDWWWDGTPHQTTIESTESKRCGLLRTIANSIENPAGTPLGRGRSTMFFALIGDRKGFSTVQPRLLSRDSSIPGLGIEPASVISLPSTPAAGRRSVSVPA